MSLFSEMIEAMGPLTPSEPRFQSIGPLMISRFIDIEGYGVWHLRDWFEDAAPIKVFETYQEALKYVKENIEETE